MPSPKVFFANPAFFSSPTKAFQLPVYAEVAARQFEVDDPKPPRRAFRANPSVRQFIDDSTKDSNGESSDSDDSCASKSSCSTSA